MIEAFRLHGKPFDDMVDRLRIALGAVDPEREPDDAEALERWAALADATGAGERPEWKRVKDRIKFLKFLKSQGLKEGEGLNGR